MEDAANPNLEIQNNIKSSNYWLVKVPYDLGQKWLAHAKTGREAGKISIQSIQPQPGQSANDKRPRHKMIYTASPELLETPSKIRKIDNNNSNNNSNGRNNADDDAFIRPIDRPGRSLANKGLADKNLKMEANYEMKQIDNRDHKFASSSRSNLQIVLSETTKNKPLHRNEKRTLGGRITKFYELEPKKTMEYFQYKSMKHRLDLKPKRESTILKEPPSLNEHYSASSVATSVRKLKDEDGNVINPRTGLSNHVNDRDILSDDQITSEIFKLFRQHEYYRLDDIVKQVGQPKTRITKVLEEIGHYNTGYPHKSMWELRSDLKDYD